MTQNVGQSRGSQKHKQFVQDSANSYIVQSFKDMSETAPLSPVDGEGYIVSNVSSIHPSWGTITGLADNDIIRWRQSKLAWQITMKAVVANQGFKAFVKEEDTLYVVDSGAEWIVASGSGGGVKNFAQKQASAYKVNDWIKGNSGIFGASGTLDGTFEIETVAPLDGKKSFKYTTDAASGDDWFYLLVDVDQYARGGVLAFVLDYQWDGDKDIKVQIWDPTFTNQYSTELNVLKNTENDNKLARNSRTIFALPDTESQVVVGFQIDPDEVTGKTFIWDNIKVTDDIGVIGSGATSALIEEYRVSVNTNNTSANTINTVFKNTLGILIQDDGISNSRHNFTVLEDCKVNIGGSNNDTNNLSGFIVAVNFVVQLDTLTVVTTNRPGVGGGWNGTLKAGDTFYIQIDNQSSSIAYINILAEAEQKSTRFLQVPNGEKLKDTFGAIIDCATNNGGQPLIQSQSNPGWIDSVSRISTGFYQVNFKPGFFSVPPSISGSAANGGRMLVVVNSTLTVNGVRIETSFASGAAEDGISFTLNAVKQGADVAPDIIGVPVSIQGQTHEQDSMVRLAVGNGFGSTGTSVRRFSNILESLGNAITYIDDAVNGSRFEINETGFYSISFTEFIEDARNTFFSITKNSTALNSATGGGTDQSLAIKESNTGATQENTDCVSWSGILKKGDVIRAQTGALAPAANSTFVRFTIAKIGTQPLLDGGVVQTPSTSWRVDANGAGNYVPGGNVVQFSSTPVENRGNAVEWDASISSYRILKDGIYSFSAHVQIDSIAGFFAIGLFKNTMITTSTFFNAESNVKLTEVYISNSGNPTYSTSWTGYLTAGEYVNVGTSSSTALHGQNARSQFSVACVGEIEQYTSRVYKEDPIAWQRKTGNNSNTAAGDHLVLDFNNLEIGKTYRISGLVSTIGTINSQNVVCLFRMSGSSDQSLAVLSTTSSGYYNTRFGFSYIFIATAAKIEFIKNNTAVIANSSVDLNVTLEELPFHASTTKWT